jgi:glycyl-tRNA synthetase beta chain
MAELLLEILSEEIPARMQARAADDLKRLVCDGLKEAGLEFTEAEVFATPRRLALVVDGLPEQTNAEPITQKGPKVGAPEQAIQGFLKKVARTSVEDEAIRIVQSPKGDFYEFYDLAAPKPTKSELRTLIPTAMDALPWPKSMRWSNTDARWVRPIRNILALFDGECLEFDFDLIRTASALNNPTEETRIQANRQTRGHRFMAPAKFEVSNFADYRDKLFNAKVMLDPAKRRAQIEADADSLATAQGLTVKQDQGLLDEVTGLVEWPVVLMGGIDEQFMSLPPEVLTTSMRSHQKYFSCLDADGELANRFIVVANMETDDMGAAIVAGNERVLRARLADAKFFWDQDRKTLLASKAPALKDRVFHAKLGTMDEKVDRMQALAAEIAAFVPGADKDRVRSAARLAKADLSTGMVGEFPELQGTMGRYYAHHDGESEEVADAIAEHYSPLGPNDACPSKPESVCVALADKIDSLVGFFAIDEKPTGSKDPFALRRAALGVIRLILENRLRLPLLPEFAKAAKLHGKDADVGGDLLAFFADRLKVHLREQGVKHDHVDAVFALGGEDDLVRLMARVEALSEFLASEDGGNLLTAYKRAANILKIEEKKDAKRYDGVPDVDAFAQDEERALAGGLDAAMPAISAALDTEDFAGAMAALAKLRGPVDAFFDAVTVNADDAKLRENRLKLLNGIRAALEGVADFSRIEG